MFGNLFSRNTPKNGLKLAEGVPALSMTSKCPLVNQMPFFALLFIHLELLLIYIVYYIHIVLLIYTVYYIHIVLLA